MVIVVGNQEKAKRGEKRKERRGDKSRADISYAEQEDEKRWRWKGD
jgi:hypothetical protein